MSGTPQQFSVDLSKWVAKAKGNIDKVVRKVVLDVGTRVVKRSPVGDPSQWASPAPAGYTGGRFRANWQYSADVKAQGVSGAIDPSGEVAISNIVAGLAGQQEVAGKVHFLTNNLPYAMRLETGYSKQAPTGMIGVTVLEFQAVVSKAAKETHK